MARGRLCRAPVVHPPHTAAHRRALTAAPRRPSAARARAGQDTSQERDLPKGGRRLARANGLLALLSPGVLHEVPAPPPPTHAPCGMACHPDLLKAH
eukprot:611927-Prymnesium_polylepis.1